MNKCIFLLFVLLLLLLFNLLNKTEKFERECSPPMNCSRRCGNLSSHNQIKFSDRTIQYQ
jgi:hypothetical protein